MINPDVLCQDITIFVKIFEPYNAFKGNNSKNLTGQEIFLNPYVPIVIPVSSTVPVASTQIF
jgi:hypothetical protein